MVKQAFKICGFYSILENILPWMRRLWASNSTLIACSHGKGTQGMIAKWFCIKPLSWRILIIWATDPSPRILESVPLIFYARWGWITYMDRELALHPRSQNRLYELFFLCRKVNMGVYCGKLHPRLAYTALSSLKGSCGPLPERNFGCYHLIHNAHNWLRSINNNWSHVWFLFSSWKKPLSVLSLSTLPWLSPRGRWWESFVGLGVSIRCTHLKLFH